MMPSSLAAHLRQCDTEARKEASMFVELDTRHDARYSVSLEWDRDSGEKAGEAFRHPFRYAP